MLRSARLAPRPPAALAAFVLILFLLAGGSGRAREVSAVATVTSGAHALTAADVAAFFDGIVPYAIRGGNIAGATISVVANGQIVFAKGYGFADVKAHRTVLADQTLFRVGSISKTFTWTAVMQLVQAGKLDLDRDVNDYLDFRVPERFGKPITLRNLMTHTPGFEDTILDAQVPAASDFVPYRAYLVAHLPAEIFPPGKVVAYSNYGAMLAGYIVQRVSGEPYNEYIARHILQPLAMMHSTFEQPLPPALAKDMATGYLKASDDQPAPFEYLEVAPAGALSATAVDMAHFMIAQLEGGSYGGASIMSAQITQLMHTPQSRMAPGMNGYDLGFYQENRNGLRIIGHEGDTTSFHSDMHLLLDQHVGFFISLNSVGEGAATDDVREGVFRAFLDRYYPYTPPTEATLPHPQADAARVAGWYMSSRRIESALRIVNGLQQSRVTALPSGEIEASVLKNLAGIPKRWREVGPLTYREVGGQTHLRFVTDSGGRVAYWISDDFIPVLIFQRVHGLGQQGELSWMGTIFLVVLILTLAIWIGGGIIRRRCKAPLVVSQREKQLRLASRVGVLLLLAVVLAWFVAFALLLNSVDGRVNGALTVAYAVGVLGLLGGLAVLVAAVRRVLRGPGGRLVRAGEALLALSAIYGIWAILYSGLASFSYRY
jgi:CubicO group peptidase (beta-lactamase class C family)